MTAVSVMLVDDQSLFRAGVRMLLDSQADLRCVAEAGDGAEAVLRAREHRPDVILMDLRMPVMDGLAATEAILSDPALADRRPRIIVLTTFDLDEAAARALRAGASGFILKDADPEFLLAAIRTVHSGSAVIAPGATAQLLEHFSRPVAAPVIPEAFESLTSREREVFHLAARGLSNSEIARREYVSEATVKTHISRVLAKLELRDRVQLVVFAYEHGLAG